jgi:inorganic pyrophosphatase
MIVARVARWKSKELAYRIQSVDPEGVERFYLKNSKTDQVESFWKTFPPTTNDYATINGIIEVPYSSLAKFELKKQLKGHPHAQDYRKVAGVSVPRFYQMATLFNYGYVPQTWDSNHRGKYHVEGLVGDMDPLDIVEVSGRPIHTRLPTEMVVIGALGLVDLGELDWKILTLDVDEAKRLNIHNLDDALKRIPERLIYVRDFFQHYKTLEGKPENYYIENARFFNQDEAREIVRDAHVEYSDLLTLEQLRETATKFNLV